MMCARLVAATMMLMIAVAPAATATTVAAGAIDPHFGVRGMALLPEDFSAKVVADRGDGTTLVLGGSEAKPRSLIVGADGRIVPGSERTAEWLTVRRFVTTANRDAVFVLGYQRFGGTALMKLDMNGIAVPGFSDLDATSGLSDASGLAIAGDGSLLVSGTVRGTAEKPEARAIRRIDGVTGKLMPSWGGAGEVVISGATSELAALAIDGQQRVLAATSGATSLYRMLPDGSLDPTFGTGGVVRVNDGSGVNAAALHVVENGSIVLVGSTYWKDYKIGWAYGWATVLDATGKRTGGREFGSGTSRFESFFPGEEVSPSILGRMGGFVTTGPGRIVAWGSTGQDGNLDVPVTIAFTPEGNLDAAYGDAGLAIANQMRWPQAQATVASEPVLFKGGVTRIAIAGPADTSRPQLKLPKALMTIREENHAVSITGVDVEFAPSAMLTWDVRDGQGPAITEMGWRSSDEQKVHTAITQAESRRFFLGPGDEVCAELRARDAVGRASDWRTRCLARPEVERSVQFGRGWSSVRRVRYTNGIQRISRQTGLVAKIASTRSVASYLLVTKCPACGSIQITDEWGGRRVVSLQSRHTLERQIVPLGGNSGFVVTTRSQRRVMIDGVVHMASTRVTPPTPG